MTDHTSTETTPAALAPASAQDLTLIPGKYDLRQESSEPVHEYFELTYAQFIVLPRTVLQSMPTWWQQEFVRLMRKYDEAREGLPQEMQDVEHRVQAGQWCRPFDLDDAVLTRLGWSYGDEDESDTSQAEGPDQDQDEDTSRLTISDPEGQEHSAFDYCVFVPYAQDPIPHYQRGRTRLPLARILRTTHS